MHGLPLFRARSVHPVARRFALACALAVAGLTWAAPDVAEAYSEACAIKPAPGIGVGRIADRLKSSQAAKFFRHVPRKFRGLVATMRAWKGAKEKPAVLQECGSGGAKSGEARTAESGREKRSADHGKDKRVLIVDDDLTVQVVAEAHLKRRGHDTVVAARWEQSAHVVAAEGIKIIEQQSDTLSCVVIDGLGGLWKEVADVAERKGVLHCVFSGDGAKGEAEVKAWAKAKGTSIPYFPKPLKADGFARMSAFITGGVQDDQKAD